MSVNKINEIKNDIVNRIVILSVIFMLLPLLSSLSRIFEIGWQNIYIAHVLLYIGIALTFFFRNKLSTVIKLNALITIYAITGLAGLYSYAFSGVYIFIILAISFLAVLSNRKLTIVYISVFLLVFILIAFGYTSGKINAQINLTLFSHSITQWITHSLSLVSFIIIFIGGFRRFYSELIKAIDEKTVIENKLILQNNKLKKATLHAEVNEHRLLTFINSIPDIVCYKDGKGRWLLANKADLELFSLTNIDYVGKTDKELSKDTAPIYKEAFENCVFSDELAWKNKKLTQGIETIPLANGGHKSFEIYKIPLFHENGERKSLAVIGRDITNLKKTENELIAAKERAEKSDKLKTAFLNNMSHEIRTPMNGIIGFSKMLTDPDRNDQEKNKFANIIIKSSEQLLQLVNDILDIAKIEANEVIVHEEEIDMLNFCMETMAIYTLQAKNKDLELFIKKNHLVHNNILIDKYKFQQILNNLISNAIKFTDTGNITVACEQSNNQILFSVSDTGRGIKKEYLDSIFDRFHQVEENNSDNRGTGLGLAICKGLVTIMKGKIWVESELGKGSTFKVSLPYKTVSKPNIKKATNNKQDYNYDKKTILIAEDEDVNYLFISELLNQMKLNIIRSKNGQEALEMVKSHPEISLILMDIKMPIMDGYKATRIIKNIRNDIPIIALTAHAFSEDKVNALKAGCDDFISKPIDDEKLFQCLDKYLKL